MPSEKEEPKKRPQFRRDNEEIRADAFIRATQKETKGHDGHLENIPVSEKNYQKFVGDGRSHLPKGIWWGIGGLILLFIAGFAITFFVVRGRVVGSIATQIGTLQSGVEDLQNLDTQAAQQKFSSLNDAVPTDATGILGMFGSIFGTGKNVVASFSDLSAQLTLFSAELTSAQNTMFGFITTGQGGALLADLNNIKATLAAIDADSSNLNGAASSFGASAAAGSDFYLPLKTQVEGAERFLTAFIPWFSNPAPHHLLVLLENSSELRPGGGFLGSYADVTIASGTITDIAVHDIADVDAAFAPNVVPPKPLQLEVKGWRPADGNWFFDFPTSASKTIQFFQQSSLYSASSTTFDAAIAVSPKVISDLLSLTGPVTFGKPSTTFTSDNLVIQIQKIVQAGQAQSATYPKNILTQLSDAVFQKLASSTDADKQTLLSLAFDWIAKKDVMVYATNHDFESFADTYGASGAAYALPQNFNGDYLAIVNANIRGDKSDLYTTQDVNFETEINGDGTATDHLIIKRTDTGDTSPYWWYKTTNQDYVQVFTPRDSSLGNESGGSTKTITPPVDYEKENYATDPLIAAIESTERPYFSYPSVSTHIDEGKQVFGTWVSTKAGSSATLSYDYARRLYAPPADGQKYEFIFEKQSGAQGHYKFSVNAPLGYRFAENGLASFDYVSDDPPGRLILDLTLQKI